MRELNVNEMQAVNGGHPVVAVVAAVVKSTVVRNVVKGAIAGVGAKLGYEAVKSVKE